MEANPDLPSDLQREVLLRVPYNFHDKFKVVCDSWEAMMSSPQFYADRRTYGKTQQLICLIQSNIGPPLNITVYDPVEGTRKMIHSDPRRAFDEHGIGITVYDPLEGTRKTIPPIPYDSGILEKCELVPVNRKLVLFGGCSDQVDNWARLMKLVFVYDFQSSKWHRGADMLTSRSFFACSVSSSKGLIYVAGGRDEHGNTLATAEAYDVEADKWEILPPMTQNRERSLGVFMEGKFMVIGGTNQRGVERSAEVFDAKTGTWKTLEDVWRSRMPINRCQGFVSTCGNLYVIDRKQVMKYDAQKNLWTFLAFLPQPIAMITSAASWGDRIFVSGVDNDLHTISYLFQPSTGQWIAIDVGEDIAGSINMGAATLEI